MFTESLSRHWEREGGGLTVASARMYVRGNLPCRLRPLFCMAFFVSALFHSAFLSLLVPHLQVDTCEFLPWLNQP